jgi:TPR repeat protein
MRPLEHYLARIRAFPARPVAINATIESDDHSAGWELTVIYEEPLQPVPGAAPWKDGWIDHRDELNGEMPISVHTVLGRRHGEMRLAFPPDDIIVPKGSGAYTCEPRERAVRDLEGAERACAEELARGLAEALGVRAWIDSREGPYRSWWDRMLWEAAELGDPRGQTELASELLGRWRKGNATEAATWFRKAATRGFAEAQYRLAGMLNEGLGLVKNPTEAFFWYSEAADQGHPGGQEGLAIAYLNGAGVARNEAEGVQWLRRAASQQWPWSEYLLGMASRYGWGGLPRQDEEAVRLFRLAADHQVVAAKYRLGVAHALGEGVPRDAAQAVRWYREAAERGHAKAEYALGAAYERGIGVELDISEARRWYQKAAEQDAPEAKDRLKVLDRELPEE